MGMAPSLLYPTSTSTSPLPTCTTRPRTTSPSSNSLVTLSPYQSSIRSSAASSPPPRRGSPRTLRGSSVFILPVPPINEFGRSSGSSHTHPADCSTSVTRDRRPRVRGARGVTEARDRRHHLAAHGLVVILPARPRLLRDRERGSKCYRHFGRTGKPASPRPSPATAADVHGNDRRLAQDRQHTRSGLRGSENSILPPRPLGEDQQRSAASHDTQCRAQRPGIGALATQRTGTETTDQTPEHRDIEQLGLGQEAELPSYDGADERRVKHTRVVGDEQDGPHRRHMLGAPALDAEEQAHDRHGQELQDRVQHC